MLPGADTQHQPAATEREALYVRAVGLLPDGAAIEQVMRLAEWLHTGGPVLDPARVTAAARVRAAQDTNRGYPVEYDNLTPSGRASYNGHAAQVVLAYLTGSAE
jgi:hypothetical protein